VTRVPAFDLETERYEVPRRRVPAPILLHPALVETAAIVRDADHLAQVGHVAAALRIEAGLIEKRAARKPRPPFAVEREPKLPSRRIGDALLAVAARARRRESDVVAEADRVECELVLRAERRRNVDELVLIRRLAALVVEQHVQVSTAGG